jgi:hypothetical protein
MRRSGSGAFRSARQPRPHKIESNYDLASIDLRTVFPFKYANAVADDSDRLVLELKQIHPNLYDTHCHP